MAHIGDNPQALSKIIEGLGGTIVDNDTFSFPVEKVTEVIPKLEALGIRCKCERQYRDNNPRTGKLDTIGVFAAFKV